MAAAYAQFLADPEVSALFEPPQVLQAMLNVERALVQEQAALGMVSAAHAAVVSACCSLAAWNTQAVGNEGEGLRPDVASSLVDQASVAGSLAIPLVQALRGQVAQRDPQALPAVHLGATSQDLIDTALSLQGARAVARIDTHLHRLLQGILRLQQTHGREPLLARTLMQPASPTVLEARLFNWALPIHRSRSHLARCAREGLTLQLAGAVGTGAAWGQQAAALRRGVATRLGLPLHPFAWQVQRDLTARLAAELGILAGALGKVAADVALMAQAEVNELQESPASGRGTSSAMAHKRNPVGAMVALSALQRAPQRVASVIASMAQAQERSLGLWQAEGAELADLFTIVAGSAQAMADALDQAVVNPAALAAHLRAFETSQGAQAPQDGLQDERAHWWAQLAAELGA